MNAPEINFKVAKRFHDLRRRYFGVRIGIGIAIAVIALLSVWMLLTAGDYVWEWALTWRKAGLLVGAAAVCVWLARRMYRIVRDTRQRQFAAKLENSFEDFGQRIRTVLDTVDGRVSGPDEMLDGAGTSDAGSLGNIDSRATDSIAEVDRCRRASAGNRRTGHRPVYQRRGSADCDATCSWTGNPLHIIVGVAG